MSGKFQNKYRILSARASWWDYSSNGAYFVTIVTHDRECCFGNILNKKMEITPIGEIAQTCWQEIPSHFPFVVLDSYFLITLRIIPQIGTVINFKIIKSFKYEHNN
jgi:putative transposase